MLLCFYLTISRALSRNFDAVLVQCKPADLDQFVESLGCSDACTQAAAVAAAAATSNLSSCSFNTQHHHRSAALPAQSGQNRAGSNRSGNMSSVRKAQLGGGRGRADSSDLPKTPLSGTASAASPSASTKAIEQVWKV